MTDTKSQPLTDDDLAEIYRRRWICAAEVDTANRDDVIRLIRALEAERADRLALEADIAAREKALGKFNQHKVEQLAKKDVRIREVEAERDRLAARLERIRQETLEAAAREVEQHDKRGREWVPGSLWDKITREATSRIRALAGQGEKKE